LLAIAAVASRDDADEGEPPLTPTPPSEKFSQKPGKMRLRFLNPKPIG
jgi:hypothetical protein